MALPLSAGVFSGEGFQPVNPAELSMTEVPLSPGAPAAVLEWTRRRDDAGNSETEYSRIKIFGAEGKKYGDLELMYIPGYNDIGGIKARTIHADGTIIPFTGKIYDKLVIRTNGARVMAKTFSLPDVQPGSIIEYRYDTSWLATKLLPTHWVVQRDLPVLQEHLWLRPYLGYSSLFTYWGLPGGKTPEKKGDHYELDLTNIAAFEHEAFAPPDEQILPRVAFFYTEGTIKEDEFWKKQYEEWTEAIETFIGDRSGIRKSAQEIVGDAKTPEEKLRRLYTRVEQIRNLTYEKSKTEQESSRSKDTDNRQVEDVLVKGYGWSNQLTRLFVALARGAGFEAHSVRLTERDTYFFARNILDGQQLNGEMAMVVVDGKPLYLDPGTPYAPYGVLAWEKTNTTGMLIAKKKELQWLQIPPQDGSHSVTERKADLRLDDDMLKGTVTITYAGHAALRQRLAGRHEDEEANRKRIEDSIKVLFPDGSTVKLTKLTGLRSIDDTVVAQLDVELANIGSSTGTRTLLPMAVFNTVAKNPFAAEHRKYPPYFESQWETRDEVTIALPEGATVESKPHDAAVNMGAVGYTNEWAQTGNTATFKRHMFINATMIPVENYEAIREFYTKVGSADQESLVLRNGAAAPKGTN